MSGWIDFEKDDAHVKREREKARVLRESAWWKSQIAPGICRYCGRKVGADALTMDHIIPVARGGKSVKSNVAPCCDRCNKTKRCTTPAEIILDELELGEKLSGTDKDGDTAGRLSGNPHRGKPQ